MTVAAIDKNAFSNVESKSPSVDQMRDVATKFEAILLMQLTKALNSTGSDDEDSLFGSDGGSGLAKQMFAEQMATTMSENGGVGLADAIMRQFGVDPAQIQQSSGRQPLSGAISAARNIRYRDLNAELFQTPDAANASPIRRPLTLGNPDDAEVISTFEDDLKAEGIDASLKNLVLDGRVVNTTRPRVAPNAAINNITPSAGMTSSMPAYNAAEAIDFQMPVLGRVSSGFGNRFHPIDQKVKFHAGLDLAVPLGTQVDSAAAGIVKFAGPDGDYGNLVIIQHPDGRETRYGHLSKMLVSENQQVAAGQAIALSGSTGKSTGPHLHFEVRENGQVINPLKVLSNVLP